MSGKFNSLNNVMFLETEPIISSCGKYIRGVVVIRRQDGDGKKISKEEAKKILKQDKYMLEKESEIPLNSEYLEPVKKFVCQEKNWEFGEFVLSTLINSLDKTRQILKQRVWFFELKNYILWDD